MPLRSLSAIERTRRKSTPASSRSTRQVRAVRTASSIKGRVPIHLAPARSSAENSSRRRVGAIRTRAKAEPSAPTTSGGSDWQLEHVLGVRQPDAAIHCRLNPTAEGPSSLTTTVTTNDLLDEGRSGFAPPPIRQDRAALRGRPRAQFRTRGSIRPTFRRLHVAAFPNLSRPEHRIDASAGNRLASP